MGNTTAQKIFASHKVDQPEAGRYVLRLDAVFCHEITTPGAILDLQARGKDRVFDTGKIKAVIDHVSPAKDSKTALQGKILRDWARRHEIKDFFDIGHNGVCHALFPEKGFVRPGYTVIMGDSHTCTHGAFGAFAAGVGTTDLEVGILKGVGVFRAPETMKIVVNGTLRPGVYAKDLILHIIGAIGVNGATDKVIEFHGEAISAMSMESRMTLSNMAVEAGGTSGICMPDTTTVEYLWPFIQDEFKTRTGGSRVLQPFPSRQRRRVCRDRHHKRRGGRPTEHLRLQARSNPSDSRVRRRKGRSGLYRLLHQRPHRGSAHGGRGTEGQNRAIPVSAAYSRPLLRMSSGRALAEGIIDTFMQAGFCVTNPTCGACLGMSNGVLAEGEVCASTTNRNFNGRMGKGGMVHLMSPASAAAAAVEGRIGSITPLHSLMILKRGYV